MASVHIQQDFLYGLDLEHCLPQQLRDTSDSIFQTQGIPLFIRVVPCPTLPIKVSGTSIYLVTQVRNQVPYVAPSSWPPCWPYSFIQ